MFAFGPHGPPLNFNFGSPSERNLGTHCFKGSLTFWEISLFAFLPGEDQYDPHVVFVVGAGGWTHSDLAVSETQ